MIPTLTSANILEKWDGYLASLANVRVNRDRVVAYIEPGTYKLLKEAAGLTSFVDTGAGFRGVDRNVARLDGVKLVEVPADLMKSAYVFTTGWSADANAKQIFGLKCTTGIFVTIVQHVMCVLFITKENRTVICQRI